MLTLVLRRWETACLYWLMFLVCFALAVGILAGAEPFEDPWQRLLYVAVVAGVLLELFRARSACFFSSGQLLLMDRKVIVRYPGVLSADFEYNGAWQARQTDGRAGGFGLTRQVAVSPHRNNLLLQFERPVRIPMSPSARLFSLYLFDPLFPLAKSQEEVMTLALRVPSPDLQRIIDPRSGGAEDVRGARG